MKKGVDIRIDQFKGLIFDLDGTLVDTMPLHLEAWALTAKEYSFKFDKDWFNSLGGIPIVETIEHICSDLHIKLNINEVNRFRINAYHKIRSDIDIIQDTYKIILENNYKLPVGVATGSSRVDTEYALEQTGLSKFIDAFVCSDDVVTPKPDPETYIKAAYTIGILPSECLAFEDTKIGYDSATQAGMNCLMVVDGVVEGNP